MVQVPRRRRKFPLGHRLLTVPALPALSHPPPQRKAQRRSLPGGLLRNGEPPSPKFLGRQSTRNPKSLVSRFLTCRTWSRIPLGGGHPPTVFPPMMDQRWDCPGENLSSQSTAEPANLRALPPRFSSGEAQLCAGAPRQAAPLCGRAAGGGVRPHPISPAERVPLCPTSVVSLPLSRPALRRRGKMAAEKQVPGGGGGGGGGSTGSGGGRGAGGEENKENERPSAGSKANKEFGDSLSLEILQIIKESQQQHGLRHGDFQRYRGYCSRRQRRLRKTLNFKMGNRHKFTGKKVTEDLLTDNRYLLLVLMDAERAWSYAMQLKQEANTEPRKRFHLLSRLRKAVKHAEELERLCESNRVDAKTKLEAQAYTAYLSGMLRFEHQEWKAAIEAFNKCKTIYEKLASAFTEEQAVLYNQRVEEISPNIRYCAYNIGDQSAINELMQMRLRSGGTEGLLAEKLEALITQTRAKQAATMSEVEWRGRTVPVKIDKVRIFLLGLADNEAAIAQAESEGTKERLFESMLSECRDAIQAVREELKPDQKQRDYTLDGESGKVSNLQYLHSYLTYIKLSTAIRRNENMAKGLQKALLQQQPEDDSKRSPRPQDLIRLYDIILQNLVELLQLPGLEEDRAFQKEIGLKTLVFKAYRCFFIAQSYVLVKKWSEALVLYDRVLKYANEVNSDAGTFRNSLKDLPDVQELITQVRSEKCSLQAAAILDANDSHQTETSSQVRDNKPLVERFETFCLDPSLVTKQANLVHFPPGFQPIPCKPLFFDLALNHVAFPPLEDKLEQKTKSGLTGYIKGIFGFRS